MNCLLFGCVTNNEEDNYDNDIYSSLPSLNETTLKLIDRIELNPKPVIKPKKKNRILQFFQKISIRKTSGNYMHYPKSDAEDTDSDSYSDYIWMNIDKQLQQEPPHSPEYIHNDDKHYEITTDFCNSPIMNDLLQNRITLLMPAEQNKLTVYRQPLIITPILTSVPVPASVNRNPESPDHSQPAIEHIVNTLLCQGSTPTVTDDIAMLLGDIIHEATKSHESPLDNTITGIITVTKSLD